jgi:hypothetical protein
LREPDDTTPAARREKEFALLKGPLGIKELHFMQIDVRHVRAVPVCTQSGQKHDLAPGVASLKQLERVAYIA